MKKTALICAILSFVLLLGGCSTNSGPDAQSPDTAPTIGIEDVLGNISGSNSDGESETPSQAYIPDWMLGSGSQDESESESTTDAEDLEYLRVDKNGVANKNGNYVLFGTWPQSEVTDDNLVASLNQTAGTLPANGANGNWTSYKYYIAYKNTTDFMWYQDVEIDGETYRGVYFSYYRPKQTGIGSSAGNSQQDEHGYTQNTTYWFKWEPIQWRMLDVQNGNALLLCEMLIDAQAYQNHFDNTNGYILDGDGNYVLDGDGNKISANNYAHSTIRAWLADTFYENAFTDLQKAIIQKTTVDNSITSTIDTSGGLASSAPEDYVCEDTQDYVFLLSENEVTRANYGFSGYNTYDSARQKKTTAYANCQGAQTSNTDYTDCGWWWLRSPHSQSMGECSYEVYNNGKTFGSNTASYTTYGICPALWIKL